MPKDTEPKIDVAPDPLDPARLAANAWRWVPAGMATWLTMSEPEYARFTWPKHIDVLSIAYASAIAGRDQFLCVSLPPQHAKTSTLTVWSSVWLLENFPHKKIIHGSYSAESAERSGRATRDLIMKYEKTLSVRVSQATSSVGEWETTKGGGMVSVGVGGSATGRPGSVVLIDDPHKDAAEANSPTIRDRVWEWFRSVMVTRRAPDAPIIVIGTRWHPDDLIGRISREQANNSDFPRFKIMNLKAIAESDDPLGRAPGEALWPERYSRKWLDTQKQLLGSYLWNTMYQGRPSAPEGNFFKREWMDYCRPDQIPEQLSVCRYWDLAATVEGEKGNADPDWTAGVKLGRSSADVFYVLDVIRRRASSGAVESIIRKTAQRDGISCKIRMAQDPGQAGKDQIRHYAKLLQGFDFRGKPKMQGKIVAAGPVSACMERGEVKILRAGWNDEFVEELCEFPTGGHDDQVDALSGAHGECTSAMHSWTQEDIQRIFSYRKPQVRLDLFQELRRRRAERAGQAAVPVMN